MFESIASRRSVLKSGIGLGGVGMLLATGGCEAIRDAIANRPLRRSAGSPGAAADLATYDQAVAAMKALPASDPRSWQAQAQIHQSFCPHGNWFFLPWHRAYLYYFERICRTLTGVDDFALPVWNWQTDRAIPAPFWAGSLDHSPRSAGPASLAGLSYIGETVMETIMDETNFESFASFKSSALRGGTGGGYGAVEATPHNNIHGFVGGTMSSFLSPLDPVFWCHHNMVDCMWAAWNNDLGNLNTDDSDWTQFDLAGMFVDGDGSPASMTCGATVILPLLAYRFETMQKGDADPTESAAISRATLQAGGNIAHSVRQSVSIGSALRLSPGVPLTGAGRLSDGMLEESVAPGGDAGRLLVRLSGVANRNDDAYLRVFINRPDAGGGTSIDDPHYAGSVGFFTMPGMAMPDTYYVDISRTVARLVAAGRMAASDPVSVTLVSVPHAGQGRRARVIEVGRMDLITAPAALRGQ